MSRRANCGDGAPPESSFASPGEERVHGADFAPGAEAGAALFESIELLYGRVWRHLALGSPSAADDEQAA